MKVPIRVSKLEKKFVVEVNEGKLNAYSLKYALRQVCREKCPIYFEKVEFDIDYDLDTEVEVTNFGRWLFGVKGFKGHYTQRFNETDDKKGIVEIAIPDIKEAVELIKCGLKNLEKEGFIKIL